MKSEIENAGIAVAIAAVAAVAAYYLLKGVVETVAAAVVVGVVAYVVLHNESKHKKTKATVTSVINAQGVLDKAVNLVHRDVEIVKAEINRLKSRVMGGNDDVKLPSSTKEEASKNIKGFKHVKSCTSKNVLNMRKVLQKNPKMKMGDPCLAIEGKDGKLYGLGPDNNIGGKDPKGKPVLGGSACNAVCGTAAVSGQVACAALVFDEPECGIGVASAAVACNAACK